MWLLSIVRITLEDVLKYELSPILLSVFENTGEIRALKSKADLKKALQVDTSLRLLPKPNVVIIMAVYNFGLHHGQLLALLRT